MAVSVGVKSSFARAADLRALLARAGRVLPIADAYDDYAHQVQRALRQRRVRADVDLSGPSLGKRIRQAALQKVPNVLVVGEREREGRSVSLRRHGSKDAVTLALSDFQNRIADAIETCALHG